MLNALGVHSTRKLVLCFSHSRKSSARFCNVPIGVLSIFMLPVEIKQHIRLIQAPIVLYLWSLDTCSTETVFVKMRHTLSTNPFGCLCVISTEVSSCSDL